MKYRLVVTLALMMTACGGAPQVAIQRQMYAPPKPPDCPIKVANISPGELGPLTPYDVLGTLIIGSSDGFDPFDPGVIKALQPAVCKLGGDQVSLGTQTATAGGSTVIYFVSKRRDSADAAQTGPASPPPATTP